MAQDLRRVEQALADLRPHSAGVDDLAAFAIAADAARTAGVPHAELILLDSGLDDRRALDFTTPWGVLGLIGLSSSPARRWWISTALAMIAAVTSIGFLSAFGVIGRMVVF